MRDRSERLTVVLVHNFYQWPGGEDLVFQGETQLLRQHGHRVEQHTVHNDAVREINPLRLAAGTVWSRRSAERLRQLFRDCRPDVVHFHNTFPLISPAAYYAAQAEGVPVVQTLHNYRMLCANAVFFREGRTCQDCRAHSLPWPAVLHSCYRGSRAATAATAAMQTVHRLIGTWRRKVDLYIAISAFVRDIYVSGGLPAERIMVKPNYVDRDPGPGPGGGGFALYVGRLSPEKGVSVLLRAWQRLGDALPLVIAGDGPLQGEVKQATASQSNITWLGHQPAEEIDRLLSRATVLICPTEGYEAFGRVIAEAYAHGTPVIGSDRGAISELVEDGVTGLLYRPGDADDLAQKVSWLLAHSDAQARFRSAARDRFERLFTAERNYELLLEAYARARARHDAADAG